jgi:hypothetical protein
MHPEEKPLLDPQPINHQKNGRTRRWITIAPMTDAERRLLLAVAHAILEARQ